MNGMLNPLIFYPAAILTIIFALLALKFKNIFYSLISAIILFFIVGLLFYVLGSEYNAVVQIAIYGVAVPIILGLAIMFTDLKKGSVQEEKNSGIKFFAVLFGGVFVLAVFYLVMTSLIVSPLGFNATEVVGNSSVQVLNAFGHGIFVKYVWAFELVSLILTIIVVGLTLLDKREGDNECTKLLCIIISFWGYFFL